MSVSTWIPLLPPLAVVGPLSIAGVLLIGSHVLPRPVPDVVALLTAIATTALCVAMALYAVDHPLVYWFGGWVPRQGFPLGIGFVVEPLGAKVAALIALLFAATLTFAWGYYDEVHAHFHVLMLLFMAGMIGFCLTHDLFNMFVWFEVMSVGAFALTGYQLRSSALEGALNFTIINTIGSYLFLAGIGLIYSRIGALDFSALALGVAANPHDVVINASFVLLTTALLVKAAQLPFHFWLADAHAVAPSPVSVIFSGAMVALGVFGIARLFWSVFSSSPEICQIVERLFLAIGAASALLGAFMALLQRHVKRLLAFSTMSHMGILLLGVSLVDRSALAGVFSYLTGHGLVKGALFMVAGILLAMCGGVDEYQLRGRGRSVWPAGIIMIFGGLLIAGLPLGIMGRGADTLERAALAAGKGWIPLVVLLAGALTGAAILRVAGRVFFGLGPTPGIEADGPTEEDVEKADRPLWLMLLPATTLIVIALLLPYGPGDVYTDTSFFVQPDIGLILETSASPNAIVRDFPAAHNELYYSWLAVLGALVVAGLNLSTMRTQTWIKRVAQVLQSAHCADVGDYATWQCVGLASFVLVFVLAA